MKALPLVVGTGVTVSVSFIAFKLLTKDVHTLREDLPPLDPALKTGHKLVDALLPKLRDMASSNNIPLGLIVGWIVKESGGKLAVHPQPGPGDTPMDERGYFQLTPDESRALGLDHQRLSTDSDYSLASGPLRIHECEKATRTLNLPAAQPGSAFYWLLVKLQHTVGSGQTKKWVTAAQAAGQANTWNDFKTYVLGEHWIGPQPKKWIPFMDDLYRIGKPFGFGDASSIGPAIAGEMHAHQRASGTWVVDGGSRPGSFPGGRDPRLKSPTGLLGLDVFASRPRAA